MALNPMARTFVPKGHGETTATSSDNNSSSRIIRGGEGHQQQPTDSTNVVICIESNNNATLQHPRNKSTQPPADGSRSTIRQQISGNNNWQQGNNNRQQGNNTNNENTLPSNVEFNSVERPVSTSDRHPCQQINNTNYVGSVPSSSSASAAALSTFGSGWRCITRGIPSLLLSQFSFGILGSELSRNSVPADSNKQCNRNSRRLKKRWRRFNIGGNGSNNTTPTKGRRRLICPLTPGKKNLRRQRQERSAPHQNTAEQHTKRIKRSSHSEEKKETTVSLVVMLCCVVIFITNSYVCYNLHSKASVDAK